MGSERTEACGRCSMTSVVDVADQGGDGDDGAEPIDGNDRPRDPFGEARIEVPEDQLRRAAAPTVALGRLKRAVDEVATRLTYGRQR